MRWGSCDDAMLDVALLIAALASVASALPGLTHGGEMLNEIIGELMLLQDRERSCDLRPRLSGQTRAAARTRPEPVVVTAA